MTAQASAPSQFAQYRPALIALGVVFLAALAGSYWMSHRNNRAALARDALFTAQQSVQKELKTIAEAKQASEPAKASAKDAAKNNKDKKDPTKAPAAATAESVAHLKLDVDAKLGESVKKLKAVANDFGGTRPAYDAQLALGDLYSNHGEPAKAVSWYKAAVDSAPSSFDKAMTLQALGVAHENAGQLAEARAAYDKALNLGDMGFKGDLLLAIARTHENAQDTAKARSTYDQIITQLPNSEHAKSAEILKAQLPQ